MEKIRIAIVGYGNIGRYALQAVEAASDMECVGIVRRNPIRDGFEELEKYKVVSDISELGKVDVAILSVPSRKVEETAPKYLEAGICTVDSYDIHTGIVDLRAFLSPIARGNSAVSIISAGWDPGSDSVVRALLQALAPKGVSYTNFGPGRSMGHSVAAKAVPGVKDALSVTHPAGKGVHKRLVYVELEKGASFADVSAAIKADPYFVHDETRVLAVTSIDYLNSMMHGVNLVREGASGRTEGGKFEFNMRINNPALTGQVLAASARAAFRLKGRNLPGCYTLIEIPVIDLLEGDPDDLVRRLV
ncbi:MAG: diaminopimelate dehydrogenase [Bacteroidales bacterium]|nr:diaminopimelate dehydrogenase [Bacteroidales bacterium]